MKIRLLKDCKLIYCFVDDEDEGRYYEGEKSFSAGKIFYARATPYDETIQVFNNGGEILGITKKNRHTLWDIDYAESFDSLRFNVKTVVDGRFTNEHWNLKLKEELDSFGGMS